MAHIILGKMLTTGLSGSGVVRWSSMTRLRIAVWAAVLVGAIAGCQTPHAAGTTPPPASAAPDAVDPGLLTEFQREVETNRSKAPSYGAASAPHADNPASHVAGVTFPFLQVTTTGVQTDGRFAKIRGRVTNPYDETVEGVRYLVSIGSQTGGGDARELDRVKVESDVTIEPYGGTPMRLDVSSMYLGLPGNAPIVIVAFAKKVGGRDVPVPASLPEWSGN